MSDIRTCSYLLARRMFTGNARTMGGHMHSRRRYLAASAAMALAYGLGRLATPAGANVVARSARMLVGFPPGGSLDVVARLLIEQMKGYAPAIIVDNRPGAGGRMALEALKASEPDGSVLAL